MGKQCTGRPAAYKGADKARMSAGQEASSLAPWPISRADSAARKRVARAARVSGGSAASRMRPRRMPSRKACAPERGFSGSGSTDGWPDSVESVFEPKIDRSTRPGSTIASPIWPSTMSS